MATQKQLAHYEHAIKHLNRAIDLRPGFVAAYVRRGNFHRDMGKFSLAIADYNQAMKLTGQPAEAYYHRGVAYGMKGEVDKAIDDFTQAIQYEPTMLKPITIAVLLMSPKAMSILQLMTIILR